MDALRLSDRIRRIFLYGSLFIFGFVLIFSVGLFLIVKSVNEIYRESYLINAYNHFANLFSSVSSKVVDPEIILLELDENFVDKRTKVDYLRFVSSTSHFPALVGGFSGIFAKTNSAKVIFPKEDGYLLVEIPQEHFSKHVPGKRAVVLLIDSFENEVVLSSVPEYVGKKVVINKKKGILSLNGSLGFFEIKETSVSNAKLALFVPLTTYLVDLAPYLVVSSFALFGAIFWLYFVLQYERRLMNSFSFVFEEINKETSKTVQGKETHFVPVKTEIEELNELQESIVRLLEAEKAAQAEMHSMMESLQDTINELEETQKVLEERKFQIIAALAEAIEVKDVGTKGHSDRMVMLALELAKELGISDPAELEAIKFGALLHDIGKIGIPEHILNKTSRLTLEEFEIMKMHPIYGEKIVKNISGWDLVADVIRHHHENIDGTGYPDGLTGDQISLRAQIVAMVDVFTALIEDRPYRRALSIEEALKVIENEMVGKKFSAEIYEAFKRVLNRLLKEKGTGFLQES
ncbi:HD-GYP domain-containing protein [Pseudothermotoga thermarum]|uniref:Metal dependent phosphohydrolase n=1 Tax=Pseudothermotoga thermarum DSM 5069 TaxID=688269 RepID=F7YXT8_9THEM|nr:HD-GYP domain-containing protein [Pseudothermotoga thermarum]AEH50733.1 metal dependent phosphohydrolase [Pseudothermotoga thermarum DSM 5069]